jgi:hypothetical protein
MQRYSSRKIQLSLIRRCQTFEKHPPILLKHGQLKTELYRYFKFPYFSLLREISELVSVVPHTGHTQKNGAFKT